MNEKEKVDHIIYSYFEDKNVPDKVQKTIEDTVVNRENKNSHNMNLKRIAVAFIISILAISSYGVLKLDRSSPKEPDGNVPIQEELTTNHEYPISSAADYAIRTWPQELYKHADLVIRGKLIKKNKSWVEDSHMVYTSDKFEVLEVLKETYNSKEIDIIYQGGVVPLKEFVAKLDEASRIKFGVNTLTEEEIEQKTFEESSLKVYQDAEYIIFLSYDEEKGYFVMCDAYGMRETKGGKIYNLNTKTFDTKIMDLKPEGRTYTKQEKEQKGNDIFGKNYCTTNHSIEVGGDAITEWSCKLCGTNAINFDTNVPKLCINCSRVTNRCNQCGKLKK